MHVNISITRCKMKCFPITYDNLQSNSGNKFGSSYVLLNFPCCIVFSSSLFLVHIWYAKNDKVSDQSSQNGQPDASSYADHYEMCNKTWNWTSSNPLQLDDVQI